MTREELADLVCHNPDQLHWYLRRIDEYTESVRRDTVEECWGRVNFSLDEIEIDSGNGSIFDISESINEAFKKMLNQLIDKEVK